VAEANLVQKVLSQHPWLLGNTRKQLQPMLHHEGENVRWEVDRGLVEQEQECCNVRNLDDMILEQHAFPFLAGAVLGIQACDHVAGPASEPTVKQLEHYSRWVTQLRK
jgi:hypothetical protein